MVRYSTVYKFMIECNNDSQDLVRLPPKGQYLTHSLIQMENMDLLSATNHRPSIEPIIISGFILVLELLDHNNSCMVMYQFMWPVHRRPEHVSDFSSLLTKAEDDTYLICLNSS